MKNNVESILIRIWEKTSRFTAISETLPAVMPLIRQLLPVKSVLLRRIDLERSYAETVRTSAGGTLERSVEQLKTCELEKLMEWHRREGLKLVDGESSEAENTLWSSGKTRGELFIASASTERIYPVLLIFESEEGMNFDESHAEAVGRLIEPLSAAAENDAKFRELKIRRDSAEADRRSLLTKLGRKKISEAIVGAEGGLEPVMERVKMVSRSSVPVLIFGETGSGKEVIARAIHTRSTRSEGPFLRVNCGAIPPELVDSELFGHERGSFTGAVSMHQGWFERADQGTLFLDEIGELPQAAQVRLLRILQDGTFERVGGQRQLTVDVRITAATHRDLGRMVSEGKFRADLWYRIAVFPIHLPPLRNRPQDMPALVTHFAERASRRFGLPPLVPTLDDIDLLMNYSWPGNIRELAAVIDRAAILGNGERLEIEKALGGFHAATPEQKTKEEPQKTEKLPATPFPTLDQAIINHIECALKATRGLIEGPYGAARLLRINPNTLRSKMRKYEIDRNRFRMPDLQA